MTANIYIDVSVCVIAPLLMQIKLFGQLSKVPGLIISNLDATALCEVILYRSSEFNSFANGLLLEATLQFIKNTKRCS